MKVAAYLIGGSIGVAAIGFIGLILYVSVFEPAFRDGFQQAVERAEGRGNAQETKATNAVPTVEELRDLREKMAGLFDHSDFRVRSTAKDIDLCCLRLIAALQVEEPSKHEVKSYVHVLERDLIQLEELLAEKDRQQSDEDEP